MRCPDCRLCEFRHRNIEEVGGGPVGESCEKVAIKICVLDIDQPRVTRSGRNLSTQVSTATARCTPLSKSWIYPHGQLHKVSKDTDDALLNMSQWKEDARKCKEPH